MYNNNKNKILTITRPCPHVLLWLRRPRRYSTSMAPMHACNASKAKCISVSSFGNKGWKRHRIFLWQPWTINLLACFSLACLRAFMHLYSWVLELLSQILNISYIRTWANTRSSAVHGAVRLCEQWAPQCCFCLGIRPNGRPDAPRFYGVGGLCPGRKAHREAGHATLAQPVRCCPPWWRRPPRVRFEELVWFTTKFTVLEILFVEQEFEKKRRNVIRLASQT